MIKLVLLYVKRVSSSTKLLFAPRNLIILTQVKLLENVIIFFGEVIVTQ